MSAIRAAEPFASYCYGNIAMTPSDWSAFILAAQFKFYLK